MSQANLTLAWVMFVWIVFSTVVAGFIGNRCISIMLKHSDSDSIEFVQAVKKWKFVQLIYYVQLALFFLFGVNVF